MPSRIAYWLLAVLILCGIPRGSAHVVQQLFTEFRVEGESWELEVLFDAGYADPATRGDSTTPQPQRRWLVDLPREEQMRLCQQAVTYLRELLSLRDPAGPVDWNATFPDFDTDPPDFPVLLNEGAYFRILIKPVSPVRPGGLEMALAEGEHPDLVVKINDGPEAVFLPLKPGGVLALSGPEAKAGRTSAVTAFVQGFLHVVPEGLDHILFMLGIFLLRRRWRPLLWQSLAFTAAHTITLGLASAGHLPVPGAIVEPLIALSITAVAVENLLIKEARAWRIGLVFLFGLVHGVGFAGALSTWIDRDEGFLTSLLSANAGVEAGQLLVLAAAWILTAGWHRRPVWEPVRKWSCVLLALTGLWWFVGRVGWI